MNEKKKYMNREGWLSIIANTLLFGLKYWAGAVTGSVALLADAWHTLSDSVSSVIVLIGGKISQKPADNRHPFGHGRAEHIAAIIIGVLLAIVAFDFTVESIHKFSTKEGTIFGAIAWGVTIISILAKEALAQYAFYCFRKTGASILKADGWHHRTDALSSSIILIGMALSTYFWWIDAVLGLIVALMIAYASYEILWNETRALIGESPDEEHLDRIRHIVQSQCKHPLNLHHIHLHRYGDHTEMSCHIKLPAEMSLFETHEICTKIERIIKDEFGYTTTVHPEPVEKS